MIDTISLIYYIKNKAPEEIPGALHYGEPS